MLDQGSPQWIRERIGKLTASRMADVTGKLKKGDYSDARRKYAMELVAERMTDLAMERYVTPAMQHGIDFEAEACERYEQATGEILSVAEFTMHPSIEYFGATPDRLLSNDGLVEVKCPTTVTFLRWRLEGVVPPEYVPQMTAQLACTRRAYCDFVAYDPRIQDRAHQLFVRRFTPTPEQIAEVEAEAVTFLAEVEAMFRKVTEG